MAQVLVDIVGEVQSAFTREDEGLVVRLSGTPAESVPPKHEAQGFFEAWVTPAAGPVTVGAKVKAVCEVLTTCFTGGQSGRGRDSGKVWPRLHLRVIRFEPVKA